MDMLHRSLLKDNWTYLLGNIYQGGTFWGLLIEKRVLSDDKMDNIKSCLTKNEKIGTLLDILPTCGPDAFDKFIETLVESSQSYIAEKLKQEEASAQFVQEFETGVNSDHYKHTFMNSFQDIMRRILLFGKQTSEVILDEHATALETSEEELIKAKREASLLRGSLEQTDKQMGQYNDMTGALARELSEPFVSDLAIADLQKQLDSYKSAFNGTNMPTFYSHMQVIVSNLGNSLKGVGNRNRDVGTQTEEIGGIVTTASTDEGIDDKLVEDGLFYHTKQQLNHLRREVSSLLYDCEEMERLLKEKSQLQEHIADQTEHMKKMKQNKRTMPRHTKQLEDGIASKRLQLEKTEQALQNRLTSAGRTRQVLYDLVSEESSTGMPERKIEQPKVKSNSKETFMFNDMTPSHPPETHKHAVTTNKVQSCTNPKVLKIDPSSKDVKKKNRPKTTRVVYNNVTYD